MWNTAPTLTYPQCFFGFVQMKFPLKTWSLFWGKHHFVQFTRGLRVMSSFPITLMAHRPTWTPGSSRIGARKTCLDTMVILREFIDITGMTRYDIYKTWYGYNQDNSLYSSPDMVICHDMVMKDEKYSNVQGERNKNSHWDICARVQSTPYIGGWSSQTHNTKSGC